MRNKQTTISVLGLIVLISLGSSAVFARGNNGNGRSKENCIETPNKNCPIQYSQEKQNAFGNKQARRQSQRAKEMKGKSRYSKNKKNQMRMRHAEFSEWFQKNYPQEYKTLDSANSRKDTQAITRKYMPIFMAEKKGHSDMAEILKKDLDLKEQRDSLVKEINNTEDTTQKALLIKDLADVVSKRFDIAVAKKKFRFNQLKKRIAELEKEVEKREAELEKLSTNKEAQIKQRIKELIEPKVSIQW